MFSAGVGSICARPVRSARELATTDINVLTDTFLFQRVLSFCTLKGYECMFSFLGQKHIITTPSTKMSSSFPSQEAALWSNTVQKKNCMKKDTSSMDLNSRRAGISKLLSKKLERPLEENCPLKSSKTSFHLFVFISLFF